MLSFAICDDEPAACLRTADLVRAWGSERHAHEPLEIRQFLSPYALLERVSRGDHFDCFLLDILMPEMTGIELGERLHTLCTQPLLIFVTASEDFYPDAFRLYAFQYLCKPVRKGLFFEVLDQAAQRCERQCKAFFPLKTADGIVSVPLHHLVYVELLAHICHFHLADGRQLRSKYLRGSFDGFVAPLLRHNRFIKTHAAFVVNLDFAKQLRTSALALTTGVSVPVSRTFAEPLQRRYLDYALQEELT